MNVRELITALEQLIVDQEIEDSTIVITEGCDCIGDVGSVEVQFKTVHHKADREAGLPSRIEKVRDCVMLCRSR